MKRQYIIPSVIVCDMQEMQMVAVSPNSAAQITGESTPEGKNLGNVSGDNGDDAWSSAAVKGSIWDDE